MCKVISTISCKGGVGKTTSTVNISDYISGQGKKVCVVDVDMQHNLTTSFGINQSDVVPSMYDLLLALINDEPDQVVGKMVTDSVIHTGTVDVIPSTAKLSKLEKILPSAIMCERLIEKILSFICGEYDYIFLDCCPGLNMFTINALTASNSVLLPVEAHSLSSDGLIQAEQMINMIRKSNLNPSLQVEGIIITKYQGHTNLCKSIRELVEEDFGDRIAIFDDHIKYSVTVAEAPSYGISLHQYAPKHEATAAYAQIAREVMAHG